MTVAGSGWLGGWIDFNNNGGFLDSGEMVIHQSVSTGTTSYSFDVPSYVFTNAVTNLYARFRLFPSAPVLEGLAFAGAADSGEVEDYRFTVGRSNIIAGAVYLDGAPLGSFGGDIPMAGIPVYLYQDANANGLYEEGETLLATTFTGLSGSYSFGGLPNGNYVVVEFNPPGASDVADTVGANDSQIGVSLLGADSLGNDFLDTGITLASVSGTLWLDLNADHSQNTHEPALAGITVFIDLNNNGQLDLGEVSAATSASGAYSLTNLPPGTYTIAVATGTLPGGVSVVTDPDATLDSKTSVTLSSGQHLTDQDFGYRGTASLGDYAWRDTNGNGTPEVGESPLAGIVVFEQLPQSVHPHPHLQGGGCLRQGRKSERPPCGGVGEEGQS